MLGNPTLVTGVVRDTSSSVSRTDVTAFGGVAASATRDDSMSARERGAFAGGNARSNTTRMRSA